MSLGDGGRRVGALRAVPGAEGFGVSGAAGVAACCATWPGTGTATHAASRRSQAIREQAARAQEEKIRMGPSYRGRLDGDKSRHAAWELDPGLETPVIQ